MNPNKSERLIYNKLNESDFFHFYTLYSDSDVMRYTYLDICDKVKARKIFQDVCEEKAFTYYCVKRKGDEGFVGFVFYDTVLDNPQGGIKSIGYILHPDSWGQGYATEMAKAIIDFLFIQTPIHKVDANGHTENLASEKVLIKLGMKKEGITRKARFKDNEWCDEFHYGILREEWEEFSKR